MTDTPDSLPIAPGEHDIGVLPGMPNRHGLLLLDLKDLRAMAQYVGDNAGRFRTQYGNIAAASIGAIQRNLLGLEDQDADRLFGEPALNLDDFLRTSSTGEGFINILAAEKLMNAPKLYATLLLWRRAELRSFP